MYEENSELNDFKKMEFVGEISNKLPMICLEQMCAKSVNLVHDHC